MITTDTPITTAARRIARELGTMTRTVRACFAADGQVIDRGVAGAYSTSSPSDGVWFSGGRTTQRAVQDVLDAVATHPGDSSAQTMYLMDLDAARGAR